MIFLLTADVQLSHIFNVGTNIKITANASLTSMGKEDKVSNTHVEEIQQFPRRKNLVVLLAEQMKGPKVR